MVNDLHIVMNSFAFGSRILKETSSLVRSGLVRHVHIAAIHEQGLKEMESLDEFREIWRVPIRSRRWPRLLATQMVKYTEFCLKVTKYAIQKRIELVNVHNLALLPLGLLIKWICGAKLIYDAHELETEAYGLRGLRQVLARIVERALIPYASLVIVVGNCINEWYRDKYSISNIVTVLNCPGFQEPRRTGRLHGELKIPVGKKIVLYQGGLDRGRGIEKLLRAFAGNDDGKHVLVLMGYGELQSMIEEHAVLYGNIYLKTAVPPEVVLEYTASADVGISYIDNPSLNDRFCLPNKLFEYIMAGLPVIVNDAPEMQRLVTENQIGVVLDELTSDPLARALEEIAQMNGDILKSSLRRTAEMYSWINQEKAMLRGYQEFVF